MFGFLRTRLFLVMFWFFPLALAGQAPAGGVSLIDRGNPTVNYGPISIINMQEGIVAYVQFDLSEIPTDLAVNKAVVRFYIDDVRAPGKVDIYAVNAAWSEETLSYNNAPQLGVSVTSGHAVDISSSAVKHYLWVDITGLARDWLSGKVPNNGIALVIADPTGQFSFDGKGAEPTRHEPELEFWCPAVAAGSSPGDATSTEPLAPANALCKVNRKLFCCVCGNDKCFDVISPNRDVDKARQACRDVCRSHGGFTSFDAGYECR